MTVALWMGAVLAALSLGLAWRNLRVLVVPARSAAPSSCSVSVLIPARDEAPNIAAALESVLISRDVRFEVLVLDDHSSDETAWIAARYARDRDNVSVLSAREPEAGQWGKPFACAQLAARARGDVLVFMDADVRLMPDALARIVATLTASEAALVSGVPRQLVQGFGERLVVPLIHFMLLGFLPFDAMRRSRRAGYGAACGQLLAVKRAAYFETGGHARIAHQAHDGIALARSFRAHGFRTDLLDLTPLASCRMYRSFGAVWDGFAKNAHEGLGSPIGILPWTSALLLGHTVWLPCLWVGLTDSTLLAPAVVSGGSSLTMRVLLARRFEQPLRDVLWHPVGVAALVAIQWYALARRSCGSPVAWKARVVRRRDRGTGARPDRPSSRAPTS